MESAQQQGAPGASSSTKELDQSDPGELYIYAIKAPATKSKYCQRLRAYLEFLGYTQDSIEDKARAFAAKARTDSNYAFSSLLRFFQMQRKRIERKEITVGTVRNYAKAIKLFYEMSDLTVAWQKIMRGLPLTFTALIVDVTIVALAADENVLSTIDKRHCLSNYCFYSYTMPSAVILRQYGNAKGKCGSFAITIVFCPYIPAVGFNDILC